MRSRLALPVVSVAILVLGFACTERVVTAVRAASLQVSPGESSVQVGAEVQLVATVWDGDGHELQGRQVVWSSSAPERATVDGGVVRGVAPGPVTITATAEGVDGEASVDVTGVPILAEPDSVGFQATAGEVDPPAAQIRVSSAGASPGAIGTTIAYAASGPVGWLHTAMDGATVPVEVTATASTTGLPAGTYRATLSVFAPAALDTVRVKLTLHVKPAPPPPPPDSPSGLEAAAADTSRIALSWVDNSGDETEFRIERAQGAVGATWLGIATVPANTTAYVDSTVVASTTYWYRVQACSSSGCSGYSAADSATTPDPPPQPPAAPSELVATATSPTRVSLSWKDNSPDETEFRLERSGGPGGAAWSSLASVPADSTAYADTTVVPATRFYYRVRACSSAGCSAFSAPDTVDTPAAPPAAPSQLSATALADTLIRIQWQDNSSDETEFRLERSGGADGSAWAQLAALPADSTAYLDAGVAPSTGYYYRVRACSDAGCSAYSATASAKTPAPPPPPPPPEAPSALDAEAISWQEVDLSWHDNSDDETEFRLERSGGAGGATWTQIAAPSENATSYVDTDVDSSTTYYYRIRACSSAGCSAYSATASATTPAPPPPHIVLDSSAITLSAVVGDSSVVKSVSVVNGGTGELTGLASSTSYDTGATGWLGTTLSATTAPTSLRLRGSAQRLLAGTYGATVEVASPVADNTPQDVAVTLEVAPNPEPWIFLDSTEVVYSGIYGGPPPGAKTVHVINGGLGTLDELALSIVYAPGQPVGWLSAGLGGRTAPTSLSLYATVTDQYGQLLEPGTYEAAVVVSSPAAANDPQTLTVRLTVH